MSPESRPATVVVVEDNADNLLVLEILLTEDVGAICLGLASGSQLWALLHKQPDLRPDLMLLDLQMPRQGGAMLLQEIRDRPVLNQTRIVAVTANVLPIYIEQARAAGFDGFIGKPIDRHRFPEQIRRLLRGEAVWEAQ